MIVPLKFLILGVIFTSISLLPPLTSGGVTNKIDGEFRKKIDSAPTGSTWTVIIIFKKDQQIFDSIYKYVENLNVPPGESYMKSYEAMIRLEKYSEETQGKVIQAITNFQKTHPKVRQSTFWISNDRRVWKAPKDLLYLLGEDETREFENITEIIEDKPIQMKEPQDIDIEEAIEVSGPPALKGPGNFKPLPETYGIEQINATAWWRRKYNGSGVIIGHIDSGVDCRHPSLKWNWVGLGEGWLDPAGSVNNTFPYEQDKEGSHGTHTLGILVGRGRPKGVYEVNDESEVDFFGVGVAPGARWMSCRACDPGECYLTNLYECGKFMECPNKKENCRYRPDIVSISNGQWQDMTTPAFNNTFPYQLMISLFKSVGIIPVFSAGNGGLKGCQTVSEPENEDIIKVGNVDKDDILRDSSSMGPPLWRYNESEIDTRKIFKPDIVAPGTRIYSTVYTGRNKRFEFGYKTGTSMAAPHVAGAIALLLSRTEGLTFDQVRAILLNHTVPNTELKSNTPNLKCGFKKDTDQPNHKFGWGRLRLPDPEDLNLLNIKRKRPTRKMPPPPDYSTLEDNSAPPKVRGGMVGVVMMMASIAFLMMNTAGIYEI